MILEFPVVTEADFPHGLTCMTCSQRIGVGRPYQAHVTHLGADGSTHAVLTCVYCDCDE